MLHFLLNLRSINAISSTSYEIFLKNHGISYKSPRNQRFKNFISYCLLEVFKWENVWTFLTTSDLSLSTRYIIFVFFSSFSLTSTSILSKYWALRIITYFAYWIALNVFVRSPPYWYVWDVASIISALVLKVFRLNTTLGSLAYWINPTFKKAEFH